MLLAFLQDEDGSAAIEYALMAALIGIVIIGSVRGLSFKMKDMYIETIAASLP